MDPRESLTNALPRFLRRCDAVSTRKAYKRELHRFLAWLPDTPTDETLFDYRDHLRKKSLGPTTIRWRTTVARSFLLFAKRRGLLDLDLVSDFKPPKGKTGFAPRVLTQGEFDRLIDAPDQRKARGRRDAAMLVCMGVGGLRAGEVCALNAQDVLIREHEVVLTVNGKGRKQRTVDLPGQWVGLFQAYLRMWGKSRKPGNPFFWGGRSDDKRITGAGIDYLVKQAVQASDIHSLHPHALRHTAATLAIQSGTSLPAVQSKLGHSSIMTTMKYLHVR
jgi:site-specific recombinase XerD